MVRAQHRSGAEECGGGAEGVQGGARRDENLHGDEIRMFLRMHGMEDLAENICVVQKKRKKGDFMRMTLGNS